MRCHEAKVFQYFFQNKFEKMTKSSKHWITFSKTFLSIFVSKLRLDELVYFLFFSLFALQFTRKPSRRLSSRSHQPQSSTENQNQDIIDGFDPAAIRSPVVLSSLANGSLKRHSSSNGQK